MTRSIRLEKCAGLRLAAAGGAIALSWFACAAADQSAGALLQTAGVKGGLVVHLGCGDGRLTAGLFAGDTFLVHGLDPDAGNIAKARAHIREAGLSGKVSVEQWSGPSLPYADNMVNLLVAEDLGPVPMSEVMRVLCPLGAAQVKSNGDWVKTVKPRPVEMDEWTHFLRGADNNAVSKDMIVGPPYHVQWTAGPMRSRSHEHMSSLSVMVSTGGRVFYIVDEGPLASIALSAKWVLIARDAFNGKELWRRAIPEWMSWLHGWTSGPVELGRRLVAMEDRVYATLGYNAPVSVLDAVTGADLFAVKETADTHELAVCDGILAVVMTRAAAEGGAPGRRGRSPARTIAAFNAADGAKLWEKDISEKYADLSLAARNGRLVFREDQSIVCLDLGTGEEKWRSAPLPGSLTWPMGGCFGVTVVATDEIILHGDGKHLSALSAKDGRELWVDRSFGGHFAPADVFVIDGMVWTGDTHSWGSPGFEKALELETGELAFKVPDVLPENFKRFGGLHHRCHRNRATARFILTGRIGAEFFDLQTGEFHAHNWVRGACQFGFIPANGLTYFPIDPCICYNEGMLSGINALAPKRKNLPDEHRTPELERGPAFAGEPTPQAAAEDDWPTYRRDAARSGFTRVKISSSLAPAWRAEPGGRLSALTLGDGKVFVASVDEHVLHALDAGSGATAWTYAAGGRVDSPPTIAAGRAVFGCADGWIYCLRAADGELCWRFRAAPEERRIISCDRLESAWPVHGSVLAVDNAIYAAAGRSSYVDGGIRVVKINLFTGQLIAQSRIYSRDPETGAQPEFGGLYMPGALPDILSSDGKFLYMRHLVMDMNCAEQPDRGANGPKRGPETVHLFSPTGFRDDSWWHRTYWTYGNIFLSSYARWATAGNCVPSGRILCVGDEDVFGYGRNFFPPDTAQWVSGEYYILFAAPKELSLKTDVLEVDQRLNMEQKAQLRRQNRWETQPPFQVRAMALAGDTLFIAGPLGNGTVSMDAYEGKQGSVLWAASASDGRKIAEYELEAVPVFDGLIAAAGGVFVALKNGAVVRFKAAE